MEKHCAQKSLAEWGGVPHPLNGKDLLSIFWKSPYWSPALFVSSWKKWNAPNNTYSLTKDRVWIQTTLPNSLMKINKQLWSLNGGFSKCHWSTDWPRVTSTPKRLPVYPSRSTTILRLHINSSALQVEWKFENLLYRQVYFPWDSSHRRLQHKSLREKDFRELKIKGETLESLSVRKK